MSLVFAEVKYLTGIASAAHRYIVNHSKMIRLNVEKLRGPNPGHAKQARFRSAVRTTLVLGERLPTAQIAKITKHQILVKKKKRIQVDLNR